MVRNFHAIPCKSNRKWVGILCNREVRGPGDPPGPPELASLLRAEARVVPRRLGIRVPRLQVHDAVRALKGLGVDVEVILTRPCIFCMDNH
jgi:hypothetical protein